MVSPAPYDLAPVLQIALAGAALAALPIAWIWARHRAAGPGRRRRALVMLALFLTFDLLLFGAFTRLSDSGLGCPDWPGCYGSASPMGAQAHIEAAQTVHPQGVVTHGKAWIEMVHRYLATGVGALLTWIMALAWLDRRRRRGSPTASTAGDLSPAWATVTWVAVCVQGAFGALTVTMKLYPAVVVAHLLGALVLVALLSVQVESQSQRRLQSTPALRTGAWAVMALVVIQVALGGWVSSNYAVLACTDFPMCQGRWWPSMDFEDGFAILRPLGAGRDGGVLPFEALTAIHMAHRMFALAVLAGLGWLCWQLARRPDGERLAMALACLGLWQLASGIGNVVLGWPLVAALAHTGGAAALVMVLTRLLARSVARRTVGLRAGPLAAAGANAETSPQGGVQAGRGGQLHHV